LKDFLTGALALGALLRGGPGGAASLRKNTLFPYLRRFQGRHLVAVTANDIANDHLVIGDQLLQDTVISHTIEQGLLDLKACDCVAPNSDFLMRQTPNFLAAKLQL